MADRFVAQGCVAERCVAEIRGGNQGPEKLIKVCQTTGSQTAEIVCFKLGPERWRQKWVDHIYTASKNIFARCFPPFRALMKSAELSITSGHSPVLFCLMTGSLGLSSGVQHSLSGISYPSFRGLRIILRISRVSSNFFCLLKVAKGPLSVVRGRTTLIDRRVVVINM